MGRMLTQSSPEGTITLEWDTASPGAGVGKLASAIGPDPSTKKTFSYTMFGQTSGISTTVKGETFEATADYDAIGRLLTVVDSSGFFAGYQYDMTTGQRQEMTAQGRQMWQALERNAAGDVLKEVRGGVLTATREYDTMRRLTNLTVHGASAVPIQELLFDYDQGTA